MDLRLAPVTAENWRTAVFLTTDPERKIPLDEQWIANNAFSLLFGGRSMTMSKT